LPWGQWVQRLKETGDADPGEELQLRTSASLAVDVLCRLGVDSDSFKGATRAEIMEKFPVTPTSELERPAILDKDPETGEEVVLTPAVQAWQETYDVYEAISRLGELVGFEGELRRLKLLLESAPSAVLLTSVRADDDVTDPPGSNPKTTNDTKNDNGKKSEKKLRPLSDAARECANLYNRDRNHGGKTPMKQVVEQYVAKNGGKKSGILKQLTDHPDYWKTMPRKNDKKTTRR
jgi:hypothetical protein